VKGRITVIGTDGILSPEVESIAYDIGKSIAEHDCILVCGGRAGVMEAACRGAKDAGGLTVGILPSIDGSDANEFVDVVVPTGMGYARNSIVVSSGDAVISVAGSTGTLSELGMALNYGKPVIAVEGSGGVSDLVKEISQSDDRLSRIVYAKPSEAVEVALRKAGLV
jgi:uncharacterized protein (TIGR00725 family)